MKFAGVYIESEGGVLLVKEGNEEAKGLWSVPLGRVEESEPLHVAAKREVKEETGLVVDTGDIIFRKNMTGKQIKTLTRFYQHQLELVIFAGMVVGGDLSAGEDVMSAEWVGKSEVCNNLSIRGNWLQEIIC